MKIEKLESGNYSVDVSDLSQQEFKVENVFEARDEMIRKLTEAMNDYIEDVLG